MKLDDASWHYGGTFPADLPDRAGAIHIGVFLAWAVTRELVSQEIVDEDRAELDRLRRREITGTDLVMSLYDEKLVSDQLSAEGADFAAAYYEGDRSAGSRTYLDDYCDAVGHEDVYRTPDTWQTIETVATVVDERLASWREAGRPSHVLA